LKGCHSPRDDPRLRVVPVGLAVNEHQEDEGSVDKADARLNNYFATRYERKCISDYDATRLVKEQELQRFGGEVDKETPVERVARSIQERYLAASSERVESASPGGS